MTLPRLKAGDSWFIGRCLRPLRTLLDEHGEPWRGWSDAARLRWAKNRSDV